jgi:uncharacterized protein (DUF927 family)
VKINVRAPFKKTRKNQIANIFHFKEKQNKSNSVSTIQIPRKFEQNRPRKVAVSLNGFI